MKTTIGLLLLIALLGTVYAEVRTYYIAAVEIDWNYAPGGNLFFPNPNLSEFEDQSVRLTYRKAVYREFTDDSFTIMRNRTLEDIHLGIMGPTIRAVVGDVVIVVFKNMASFNFTLAGHFGIEKRYEGDDYLDGDLNSGDSVPPGENYTYVWNITEENGPAPGDPSSVLFIYHSAHVLPADINSGLVGGIIISRNGSADNVTARPLDVEREFVIIYNIFDETISWYAPVNLRMNSSVESTEEGTDFEGDVKYTINGYTFGNLRGLNMSVGERVRWYVFALGADVHAPHWQGNNLVFAGRRVNSISVAPSQTATLDMVPSHRGTWGFYCHVADHFVSGMNSLYTVV